LIGIDTTQISRIEKFIDKFGQKALEKFLSKEEITLAKSPSSIAGLWAAKEAASKAIGTGIGKECSFHDIKLAKALSGQPQIKYKKHIRKKFNIKKSHLSITHDNGMAIAVVFNETK
jgi:holo-[acyl-carrier protein] synthase